MSEIFDLEGPVSNMTVQNLLSGCVDLICPEVKIIDGHEQSHISAMKKLVATKPFSLTFGGAGAGHGKTGGAGFGENPPDHLYGNNGIQNLYGVDGVVLVVEL